jgi:hypothetical protein
LDPSGSDRRGVEPRGRDWRWGFIGERHELAALIVVGEDFVGFDMNSLNQLLHRHPSRHPVSRKTIKEDAVVGTFDVKRLTAKKP